MSIVITTPTGHIGSALTEILLDADADLLLLTRNREKVARFAARGAVVFEGNQEDLTYMTNSTKDAEALFWVTPSDLAAEDVRASQNKFGDVAAEAVRVNAIPYVVNLSSIGAHLGQKTGPVNGLHDVEEKLNAVATNITHLRPSMFFENSLMSVETIRSAGSIFAPIHGGVTLPMVSTADIARKAAGLLLDRSWSGRRVVGVHGPKNISFDDVADTLTRTLGKKITHVKVTPEQAIEAMTEQGISADMARLYVELYQGLENGDFKFAERRTSETTTETTYETFAREVVKPAVEL